MFRVALLFAAASLAGCGYVGEPLPPALNIPEQVTDLRAVQRGSNIVLEFTIPSLTTESLPMPEVAAVDLRGGLMQSSQFDLTGWAASAKRYPAELTKPGPAKMDIPAAGWTGKEVLFSLRVQHPRGRFSEWSNLATVLVLESLSPPAGLRAESVAAGIRLTWQSAQPGLKFRIYRREPGKESQAIGTSQSVEFSDPSVEYGKTYEYSVQALQKAGDREAESLPSEFISIAREDRFAPSVPRALTAVVGTQSIELAWSPSPETDLAGYRVYRAVEAGPFEVIADLVQAPSYSDRAVEAGKRYRYTISSVDRLKNESARSEGLEVMAQ